MAVGRSGPTPGGSGQRSEQGDLLVLYERVFTQTLAGVSHGTRPPRAPQGA
jgi:hypothetical protein